MAKGKTKKKKLIKSNSIKMQRRRKRFFLAFLAVFSISVFATLSLTVFFKVEEITVINATMYTDEEIIEACGIEIGDNLFLIDTDKVRENLTNSFVLIEDSMVQRVLSGRAEITIREASPRYLFRSNAEFAVVSEQLKVLSTTELLGGVTIYGVEIANLSEFEYFDTTDNEEAEIAIKIIDEFNANGVYDISYVDLSNMLDIKMYFDGRVEVLLGGSSSIESKVKFASYVLLNEVAENERGELDAMTEGTVRFIPQG